MKKIVSVFTVALLTATSAFAVEIKPYVGLGVVVDKAGTSAKRVAIADTISVPSSALGDIAGAMTQAMSGAFIPNGGDDMDFTAALAGEFTVGVKVGAFRTEFEYALRSASEDSYDLYNGNIMEKVSIDGGQAGQLAQFINVPTYLATSTSVEHNSYMMNFYYDFDLSSSNWTPYIGGGLGVGTYKQYATVDVDVKIQTNLGSEEAPKYADLAKEKMVVADQSLTRFEWQAGLGAYYDFSNGFTADVGYRFNSSQVAGEFVYAHELKMGIRYNF